MTTKGTNPYQARYDAWYAQREKTALVVRPGSSVAVMLTTPGVAERAMDCDVKVPVPAFMGPGPWTMLTDWHMNNPRSWHDEPFEYSVQVTLTFRKAAATAP